MTFPAFFDEVPSLTVIDPLADFLGAAVDGKIEYRYTDAVRLAGHSCPTVAAAYAMTVQALRALWGDALPERGGVRVDMAQRQEDGVAGVMAAVAGLITGAAGSGGFKGLAGRHTRRDLLRFAQSSGAEMRFTRLADGAAVEVSANLGSVPPDPEMPGLLQQLLSLPPGAAPAETARRFAVLWQARVRCILIDHFDDPEVFAVRRLVPPA